MRNPRLLVTMQEPHGAIIGSESGNDQHRLIIASRREVASTIESAGNQIWPKPSSFHAGAAAFPMNIGALTRDIA